MAVYVCYLLLAGIQMPFFYCTKDIAGARRFDTKNYLALCCIELVLLAGFRGYTIGADTAVYLQAIDYYSSLSFPQLLFAKLVSPFDFEIGYFALTKLCVLLHLGKTGFLFIVALLIYVPVFVAIGKRSSHPYISLLCYFAFGMFGYSLGVFRQMIAISILLCGWRYIVERRFLKYLLVVLLAMTFHSTAVIALLLYALYGIRWQKVIKLLIPVEICLLLFGRCVVWLAMKIMPQYAHYLGGQYDSRGGTYLMLVLLNAVLVACIVFHKRGSFRDDLTICALILAILLQAVGYSMSLFGRIVPYFSIYLMFAVPKASRGVDRGTSMLVRAAAVCALLLLSILMLGRNQYITPYYTFFTDLHL